MLRKALQAHDPQPVRKKATLKLSRLGSTFNPSLLSEDSDEAPSSTPQTSAPIFGKAGKALETKTLYLDRNLEVMRAPPESANEFFAGDLSGTYRDAGDFERKNVHGKKTFLELHTFRVDSDGRCEKVSTGPDQFMAQTWAPNMDRAIRLRISQADIRADKLTLFDPNGREFNVNTLNYVLSHPAYNMSMKPPVIVMCHERRGFVLNSVTLIMQVPAGACVKRIKNVPCRGFHHMLSFLIRMFRIKPFDPDQYQALLCRRRRRDGAMQVVGPHNLHTTRKLSQMGWQLVMQPAAGPWETKYLYTRWGVSEELYQQLKAPLPVGDGLESGQRDQVVLASAAPPPSRKRSRAEGEQT